MRRLAFLLVVCLALPAARAFAERHSLIVLSQDDQTVYDINPSTGQVVRQVQLSGPPRDAVFGWDEKNLFVAVPDAGEIAIVDAVTFKQRGKIADARLKRRTAPGQTVAVGLASSFDGSKLYVGVDGGLLVFDSRLAIFNPEVKQNPKKIDIAGADAQHFRIQGTTEKLYYPNRQSNTVTVVDTHTDQVVKTVQVAGGPVDVAFAPGNEAWIQTMDGPIVIIDTARDDVAKTIATGGKGAGRIAIAPDIRFIASTHADTGDVTILHPLKKEIIATIKTGRGPSVPAFVPAAKGIQGFAMKDPTDQLYVTNAADSSVSIVDLNGMKVATQQHVGKTPVESLIHYTFSHGWGPPREGTARRVIETDLFTAYANAMFLYDVSPIHEHRGDMVGMFTGTGVAKMGCWDPACPPEVVPKGAGNLPYNNLEGAAGFFTAISRGTIHEEEGGSPSPRRMISFDMKPNYYRQTQPPRSESVFATAGFRKLGENARVVSWDVILQPGKPMTFPEADIAVVYLGGGLIRFVRNGTPEIVSRFFNEFDWDPRAHTMEALSNPVHIAIMEFK